MKLLIYSKKFWQWFSLVAYLAILFLLGAEKLHRSHPAAFFFAITVLTAALILVFRYIYRDEKEV